MLHIFLLISFLASSFSLSANDELLNKLLAIKEKSASFYTKFFGITWEGEVDEVAQYCRLSDYLKNNEVWESSYRQFREQFNNDQTQLAVDYDLAPLGHILTTDTPRNFEPFIEFFEGEKEFFNQWRDYLKTNDPKFIDAAVAQINTRFKNKDPNLFRDLLGIIAVVETDFNHEHFLDLMSKSPFLTAINDRKISLMNRYSLFSFLSTITEIDKMRSARQSSPKYDFQLPKYNKGLKTQHLQKIMEHIERGPAEGLFNFLQLDDVRCEDFLSQVGQSFNSEKKADFSLIELRTGGLSFNKNVVPPIGLTLAGWRLFSHLPSWLSKEEQKLEIDKFIKFFTSTEQNYTAYLYWSSQLSAKDVVYLSDAGQQISIREEILTAWMRNKKNANFLSPKWLENSNLPLALSILNILFGLTEKEKIDEILPPPTANWGDRLNLPAKPSPSTPNKSAKIQVSSAKRQIKTPQQGSKIDLENFNEKSLIKVQSEIPLIIPIEETKESDEKVTDMPKAEPDAQAAAPSSKKNRKRKNRGGKKNRKPTAGTALDDSWAAASEQNFQQPEEHFEPEVTSDPILEPVPEEVPSNIENEPEEQRAEKELIPESKQSFSPPSEESLETIPKETLAQAPEMTFDESVNPASAITSDSNLEVSLESVPEITSELNLEMLSAQVSEDVIFVDDPKREVLEPTHTFKGGAHEGRMALLQLDSFDWDDLQNAEQWRPFNVFKKTWWGQFLWHLDYLENYNLEDFHRIFDSNRELLGEITSLRLEAQDVLLQAEKILNGIDTKNDLAEKVMFADVTERAFWELCELRALELEPGFQEKIWQFFGPASPEDNTPSLIKEFNAILGLEHQKLATNKESTIHLLNKIKKLKEKIAAFSERAKAL